MKAEPVGEVLPLVAAARTGAVADDHLAPAQQPHAIGATLLAVILGGVVAEALRTVAGVDVVVRGLGTVGQSVGAGSAGRSAGPAVGRVAFRWRRLALRRTPGHEGCAEIHRDRTGAEAVERRSSEGRCRVGRAIAALRQRIADGRVVVDAIAQRAAVADRILVAMVEHFIAEIAHLHAAGVIENEHHVGLDR